MYGKCKIVHIVAVGANGEIGANGKLLWSIPEDLKFFQQQTLGHAVLMGRKTFEGLPKPLTRRAVYSISHCPDLDSIHCTLPEGLSFASMMAKNHLNTDRVIIAGGGEIYKATENIVDEVLITKINQDYPEADTFYKMPDGFKFDGFVRPSHSHWEETESRNQKVISVTFERWVRK